ncbi:MAG: endonuclease/exonuclease/phosphatase family protein [Eubacteriales bacterium]|jgi:endonuclease/exonuclease/phosphatase family metal-dependent hydrolase
MEQSQVAGAALLKVISFNVKRDGFVGRKNRWDRRKELVARFIQNSDASIVGVQELLPRMRQDVQQMLANYRVIGLGRYQGKKAYNDEHSDILVNDERVEVGYHKTFWLSKRPEKAGSRGLLALFPRICTMAEVYVKELDCRVRVFNTHLDCLSGFARVLGVHIILDQMSRRNRIEKLPTILMGDMNATPNSKCIRILRENRHFHSDIHLQDVYDALGGVENINNTYHFFNGKIREGSAPIDYIFVSEEFEVVESQICTHHEEGQYPSDHFPIMATLRLRPEYLATMKNGQA